MSWLCNSQEAKTQLEICKLNNCPDCEKCISIHESSVAMEKYGTVVSKVESPGIPHPLTDYIVEKFGGQVE
tara:strand:- start:4521 stop:4733 length:213 start_codon:yes stop_codon:yes gene_type:complete